MSASEVQSLEGGLTWEVSPILTQSGALTPELPGHENGGGHGSL